jgi:hypothetical protein
MAAVFGLSLPPILEPNKANSHGEVLPQERLFHINMNGLTCKGGTPAAATFRPLLKHP